MKPYHKIKTLWKRDPDNRYKTLLENKWATPYFQYLKDIEWMWQEKIDGTNIRAIYCPQTDIVEFRGRTDKAQIPPYLLEVLQENIDSHFFNDAFDLGKSGDAPITLYGEGFGERIQKIGHLYGPPNFCLFDVRIGDYWMDQSFVEEVAYELPSPLTSAPVVGFGPLKSAISFTERGFSSDFSNHSEHGDRFPAEGLIVRPLLELLDRSGNRIIGKIKHRDFQS